MNDKEVKNQRQKEKKKNKAKSQSDCLRARDYDIGKRKLYHKNLTHSIG